MGFNTFNKDAFSVNAGKNWKKQPRRAFKDDLSYIRGSHALKFGFTYDHQEANGFGQQNIAGQANLQLPGNGCSGCYVGHQR
jgi:hypothetical protein